MSRFRSKRWVGLALWCAAACAGCSQSAEDFASKDAFGDYVLENCVRSESHFNPRPMHLSTLQDLTGEPQEISDVNETTRKWHFEFPDGSKDLYVVLEPGASWQTESPKVFVDVHRSGLLR